MLLSSSSPVVVVAVGMERECSRVVRGEEGVGGVTVGGSGESEGTGGGGRVGRVVLLNLRQQKKTTQRQSLYNNVQRTCFFCNLIGRILSGRRGGWEWLGASWGCFGDVLSRAEGDCLLLHFNQVLERLRGFLRGEGAWLIS